PGGSRRGNGGIYRTGGFGRMIVEYSRTAAVSAPQSRTDRVRVLFIIDSILGSAGAEGALKRLIENLPAKYECEIVTFLLGPFSGDLGRFGRPVHVMPLRRTYDWNALKVALQLRRLVRSR